MMEIIGQFQVGLDTNGIGVAILPMDRGNLNSTVSILLYPFNKNDTQKLETHY